MIVVPSTPINPPPVQAMPQQSPSGQAPFGSAQQPSRIAPSAGPLPPLQPGQPQTVYVAADGVALFQQPDLLNASTSPLFYGQLLTAYAEAPAGWIQVDAGTMGNPRRGYVCSGCPDNAGGTMPYVLSQSPPAARSS